MYDLALASVFLCDTDITIFETFYNYNFLNIYENKMSKKDKAVYAICIQSVDIKIYVTSIWLKSIWA